MISERYYYALLTQTGQSMYEAMFSGITAFEENILLGEAAGNDQEAVEALMALRKDNPQLYWFDEGKLSLGKGDGKLYLLVQYVLSPDTVDSYEKLIKETTEQIFRELSIREVPQKEALRRIHDYIARHVSIDYSATQADANSFLRNSAHSIVGFFIQRSAVCDGISEVMKMLLNAADIPCLVVYGQAKMTGGWGAHAWNMVKIEGHYAHLDMTFDIGATTEDKICYDYYCVPDDRIKADHRDFTGVPVCPV